MMEIDLEERIKPGILFLNILGYELALPKVLNKWESMDIINAKNIKIGKGEGNRETPYHLVASFS